MKNNLRRLPMVFMLSCIAVPAYATAFDDVEGTQRSDKSKDGSIQRVELAKTRDDRRSNESHDGAYWFNRGYALHQSDHFVEAIEAFSHSISLRYRQATSMYNVACGYSLLNDKENALFWLERSLAVGFDRADLLRSDSDLDPLRSDPRFNSIVQKVSLTTKEAKPGKDKPEKDRTLSRLEEAINNYEQLRRESSRDGDEWYSVGSRLLRLRDLDRASIALSQSVDYLGYRGSSAMYNLACANALKGEHARALDWLERSINAGFDDSDKLKDDPDIASLRGDARFKQIQELSRTLTLSQFGDSQFHNTNYSKTRWAPAITLYESFLLEHPENGRAWFNYGYALHYSSEHAKGAAAFERAMHLGYRPPTSMYNIACAYSMMGRRDQAFEWLEKALDAGFDAGSYISDEDLNNLRSDPRFTRYQKMFDDKQRDKKDKARKDK